MTESLPPQQLEELLAGYVLGDLSPQEAEELERLLAENPQLAREVNRLEDVLQVLPYAIPEVEPPPHLRSAILEATSLNVERRRRSLVPWSRIAAGVAALLAVILGIDNYRLRQALQVRQTEGQLATLTYSLQKTKAIDTTGAQVVVNPNNLEAELIVKDLPPLPPGKVYVLWTVLKPGAPFTTDAKGAILTEVFDAQGNTTQTIAVPKVFRSQEWVTKVAITVEDAASPQEHRGSPILITAQ